MIGKIVWISGAQGMGKSTSAQILARDHGYVYYEADCFSLLKNPFNDVHAEEPSKNMVKMRNLKGTIKEFYTTITICNLIMIKEMVLKKE